MKNPEISVHLCNYNDDDDSNAVGSLINAYIEDEMGGGEPLSRLQRLQLADALQQHPKSIVLLACIENLRCGILIAFENFSTFTIRPMINIHDLFVLQEYRGNNVGRTLLESAVTIAQQRGCSRITLEVREDNPIAQRLYKSIGFEATVPEMYYWRKYLQT
jgi:ribosomal protein S18 acetylase RimI-like enzyme